MRDPDLRLIDWSILAQRGYLRFGWVQGYDVAGSATPTEVPLTGIHFERQIMAQALGRPGQAVPRRLVHWTYDAPVMASWE